ncbi:hypothetical protein Tco_0732987 [Tanacetum coccineum]
MVGKTSTNVDPNGWTWIFRNKQRTSHPIRNPFQKEVEKVATSFFVMNFPEYINAKGLWKEVKNEEEFAKSLANIWIRIFHMYVFVARFQKQTKAELMQKEGFIEVVLVKVKDVDTMSSMYRLCRDEGFDNVKIHHIGGLWLWMHFHNVESCIAFKSNTNMKSLFTAIKPVSKNSRVDKRMVWVEILGLPICAWGSNGYKKVARSVVDINGEEFDVHIHELGSLSINIADDHSSNSSESVLKG